MSHQRVVVIGAGPAGSATAMRLAARGIECVVFDRKPFPRTKACGSGLSPWTLSLLDELGAGAEVRRHAFRIDGARISGTQGAPLELRGDHETAVLLRSDLDDLLIREARRRGAELRDGVRVHGVERSAKEIAVKTSAGVVEADAVVDCSGATGAVSRNGRKGRTLHTIMAWYQGVADTSDVVELFFDKSLKPHYGWVFPETSTRVNIGIVFEPSPTTPNARERFDRFLADRLGSRLQHAEQIGRTIGHPVNVCTAPRGLVEDRLLRAGEAGWLADGATAEGIYHALLSGHLAGSRLATLFESGEIPSARSLGAYQKRVTTRLGPRLVGGRALMEALRTPVLDMALRLQSSPLTRKVLSRAFTGLYHG